MLKWLRIIGPGIAVAATGIGAGDMVAATVSGARYGTAILWAAAFGAVLKFALNEGVARWQLATGTTLLEGWIRHLGGWAGLYFISYLLLWSFVVAGALIAACGLAAHALFGGLSVAAWGILHSLMALGLVMLGRYALFERLMKVFIAAMFLVVLFAAAAVKPDFSNLMAGLAIPRVPAGSAAFILGVMGGVGGSVTLLSYGYWIRERQWTKPVHLTASRVDLGAAYILTGLFGMAVIVIASRLDPQIVTGPQILVEVGHRMADVLGPVGKWTFLTGFWAAVFSSMLGVWQGVPYIFSDFVSTWRLRHMNREAVTVSTTSYLYRGYLVYLAIPPMLLLAVNRPVWIVLVYAVVGALFMPFLAGTLLVMNNRLAWLGELRNGKPANALLALALILFLYLAVVELVRL